LRRRREFADKVASLARRGMPLKKIYKELNIAA